MKKNCHSKPVLESHTKINHIELVLKNKQFIIK